MFTTLIFTKREYQFLQKYKTNKNLYIVPKNDDQFNGVEINGSGIINDCYVEHNVSYSVEDIIDNTNDYENLQFNMKGSVCLFLSQQGDTYILPDPLGGAILYYYDSPNIKIFSNSLENIKKILHKIGIRPEKNISFFLENIATGNGGLTQSPFKNIFSLNQFEYVKISNGELTINLNRKIEDYIKNAKNKSYENTLKTAYKEIKKNIEIVSEYSQKGNKYAHLTGGFDSRLILASLLNTKSQDKFKYFCSGNKGSPDKDIATSLSRHFGLRLTNDSGQFVYKYPRTLKEEIFWSYDFTNGIIKTLNPYTERRGNIILSGGYGEILRSFYSKENKFDEFNSYNEIVSKLWRNMNSNSVFKEKFINNFSERFREKLNQGISLGFPENSILDYYYLAVRNRYFVGQISFYSSVFNSRFDPLYSCKIAIDSLFINNKMRSNNFLGLDLLKMFNEELLGLPFDTPRITIEYEKVNGQVEKKIYNNNFKLNLEEIKFVEKPKDFNRPIATDKHRAQANKMKARLWQVVEMDNTQKEMKEIIKYLPTSEVDDYVNMDKLNTLFLREINNRPDLRTLNLLYSNLIWWKKDEE